MKSAVPAKAIYDCCGNATIESSPDCPDGQHDHDEGNKLHQDAPAHKLLRRLRRATARKIEEPCQQDARYDEERERYKSVDENIGHPRQISPQQPSGHAVRGNRVHIVMMQPLVMASPLAMLRPLPPLAGRNAAC